MRKPYGIVAALGLYIYLSVCLCSVQPLQAQELQEQELQEQEPQSQPTVDAPPSGPRQALDAIHQDLLEVRFERALTGIEALLGDASLALAGRAEALVLRSQAHVALGDLAAAEADYGEILRIRPGYTPESSVTPKKAMERFKKMQARWVARLAVTIDPPEALLTVDGVAVVLDSDSSVALTTGRHVRCGNRSCATRSCARPEASFPSRCVLHRAASRPIAACARRLRRRARFQHHRFRFPE
jgi:hypothetical protein